MSASGVRVWDTFAAFIDTEAEVRSLFPPYDFALSLLCPPKRRAVVRAALNASRAL